MPTKIFVRGLDGKESVYEVELTDTVRMLKQKVFEKEHLAIKDQLVIFGGQPLLDGSKTLSRYGISADASILVEWQPNKPMTIQVRIDAESHAYEVRPKDTVGRLKEMIQSKDGILVDEQRLIYSGRILQDDDKTLTECEIQKETSVFVNRINQPMKIYVRDEENGKLKTYEVKPAYTVQELKEKIQTQEGISINEQTLMHCGEVMRDDAKTLADYKVARYATLHLTRETNQAENHEMQIFVKTLNLNGKTVALRVEPTTTVKELKEKIHEQLCLPIAEQHLIHAGKQLEDQYTIEYYGISKEKVIHLIRRHHSCARWSDCSLRFQTLSTMPESPLLILGADHKPVWEKIEQLRSTLQSDQYRNLPVKVVSAAGMMRIGKSTTMNLFMRQLRAHETTRQPIDRLDGSLNNDTELTGFPRGGGVESVTHGVYIWPQPFIVSDENGDKSVVLLMDVEGAFDGETIEESAPVFVFAALVSSAVLLNVDRTIDESVIQLLDYFVATGNTLLQNAILVVRDFTLAQTFGLAPGNELLKKKMEATDSMNKAMRTSRERIRQFVSNISCFLMPNPGQQAAEQNDWTNVRPEFLSCTSNLLCAAIRHPKLVGEQPLKCADFVTFMEPFFTTFTRDQQPSPRTLFDAMQESTNLLAFQRAEDAYSREIRSLADEIGLEDAHMQLQEAAIEHLQHVQPSEVREQLTTKLKAKLEEIKANLEEIEANKEEIRANREEIRANHEEMRNMEAKNKRLKIGMAVGIAGGITAGIAGGAALIVAAPAIAPAAAPAIEAMGAALMGTKARIAAQMVGTIAAEVIKSRRTAMKVETQECESEQEENTERASN